MANRVLTPNQVLHSPQNGIRHVVNVECLGTYSYDELESYYRPSRQMTDFAISLVERSGRDGDVLFGINDNPLNAESRGRILSQPKEYETRPGRLMFILAPEDFEAQIRGEGISDFLWPRTDFSRYDLRRSLEGASRITTLERMGS